MGENTRYLTFDLGAESGRAVLGSVDGGKMTLTEVHRFPNEPQMILDRYHWDTPRLFAEMKQGLARCVREHPGPLAGIGVDTWGVDFALLDTTDELLGLPYHYRDRRTDTAMEEVFALAPREEIYRRTGIQFMQFNSLFQLFAAHRRSPGLVEACRSLLMMPDLLNFWLTGVKATEFSIATTTQFYDPHSGDWCRDVLDKLGIPHGFLGQIVPPGTPIGPLHASVMSETGAGPVQVIAPAEHDTGSAVAAVPAQGDEGWAYISCGTWSLVGIEAPRPLINDQTLAFNLTNEGGVGGTFRVLRNVMGLWLLQRCRRAWERAGRAYSYAELAEMSNAAPTFRSVFDPDDAAFINPQDMPAAIAAVCSRLGCPAPDSPAATVRAIIESLALKYRFVIERLERVGGKPIATVHIIGGGCQNAALCQATADCTGRRVLAGPVEATALGNIAVQALAIGQLASLDEARALVSRSFPVQEYMPRQSEAWQSAYERFLRTVS